MCITAAALLNGCPLVEEIEEIQGTRPGHCETGRETDEYFDAAIHYDSGKERWIFHNWRGSGPNGACEIWVNVRDGAISTGGEVNVGFVRQTVSKSVEEWRGVIEAMGIPCAVHLLHESRGDSLTTRTPRMEILFPYTIPSDGVAGRTEVGVDESSRTFSLVRVWVASAYVLNHDTVKMTARYTERIIAHELGHALGIFGFNGATGHSADQEDVMFSYAPCDLLSLGDAATLRRVYTEDAYYRPAATANFEGLNRHRIDQ
jgi:hypothetical protein